MRRRYSTLCLFVAAVSGFAQSTATQSNGPTPAAQVPLSGRGAQLGSVSTSQSTSNTSAANGVDVVTGTVTVQGDYSGSAPAGMNSGSVLPLTLDHALSLAIRYNLGAIAQSEAVQQSEGQRRVARSSLLPNLNTVVGETVEQINLRTLGVESSSFPLAVGPFNFFDARVARLNQTVLDFVRLNNLRSANETAKATVELARNARDLVVLAVGGAYLEIIATNARIGAASSQVDTSQVIYRQAADRLVAGLSTRIDVTRSEVQLHTDQERLRSLRADRDRQKLNLARIVGLPRGQEFNIVDDFHYAPLTDMSLQDALAKAYNKRPDLQAALASVRAAEAALKAAHSEHLPNINLLADYGASGLRPGAEDHGVFEVAGTLTIPLYEGGRIRGDIQQATAALKQRQAELEDIRSSIDQDVREAFIDLSAAADEVDVAQANVGLAHETLEQARDRFLAGVADTVEVVQAQQAVVQADDEYIAAVFQHNLAKVSLSRALGGAEGTVQQFLQK